MTGLLQEGSGVFAIIFIAFLLSWRLFPLILARFQGNKEKELYGRVAAALDRNTEAVSELARLVQEIRGVEASSASNGLGAEGPHGEGFEGEPGVTAGDKTSTP
jgi:hypothetical protein